MYLTLHINAAKAQIRGKRGEPERIRTSDLWIRSPIAHDPRLARGPAKVKIAPAVQPLSHRGQVPRQTSRLDPASVRAPASAPAS
jgi:hypothetical protein